MCCRHFNFNLICFIHNEEDAFEFSLLFSNSLKKNNEYFLRPDDALGAKLLSYYFWAFFRNKHLFSMRLRFFTFCLIMSLKQALSFIIKQKSNHTSALVEILKSSVKEAHTQERIIFLLECKKAKIIPTFIQNSIKNTRKNSRNDTFQKKVDSFSLTALKEALRDAFRHRAFLWRQRRRLLDEVCGIRHPLIQWTLKEAEKLFWKTTEEDRRSLKKKYDKLSRKIDVYSELNHHHSRTDSEAPATATETSTDGDANTTRGCRIIKPKEEDLSGVSTLESTHHSLRRERDADTRHLGLAFQDREQQDTTTTRDLKNVYPHHHDSTAMLDRDWDDGDQHDTTEGGAHQSTQLGSTELELEQRGTTAMAIDLNGANRNQHDTAATLDLTGENRDQNGTTEGDTIM